MKRIMITKELNAEIIKENVHCYDLDSVKAVMGTESVVGNYHIYKIKKIKNRHWEIPISEIKKRIHHFDHKIESYQDKVKVMKQIVKIKN